ncbi:hypothetical protein GCM10011504_49990 [Siccirubricoccus deserti]|uniref:3-hydroxyacyl-ACP dehydratase n=1 Tax=Siccirubricoccus deserti TaxID=2013562 RepID=A0A9X0R4L5_9PROT|nr:3-hydroxyacyl-ACP dehydratase [Siccirubricoccus deserti]MBC4018457.1 3-hydroxyacyl-ACP dehydratase [Siccirubricoccus deserti]GGC66041.1 hypothetical protein GCM10011504_49990 [Siccirubricoccus deserti]
MSTDFRITVPAEHPALPGHFPGRPIVPGVLLLDAVLQAVAAAEPGRGRPSLVARAKFPAPVAPGEGVVVTLAPRGTHRVGFTCRCGSTTVLLGELGWPAPP